MHEDTAYEQTDEDLRHLEDDAGDSQADGEHYGELPSPLYRLRADPYNESYYAAYETELESGARVIAPTRYGKDICTVLGIVKAPGFVRVDDVVKIERLANAEDEARRTADEEKEKQAYTLCQEKIKAHNLPMKLVFAHYLFDEPKVLFFFTADSRVDFRNLVKDLVAVFKMRIELRQIGVRDEARVVGGCGVCGRVLCCHGVTDKLVPVSIKMAKDQNLSLNSLKISGPCGRLLCCLAYEFGFYREARKTMPSEGVRIPHDGTVFRVIEVNVPAGKLRLAGEDGRYIEAMASRFYQKDGRWAMIDEEKTEE
ncbi:MAG: regulatory iron-sulfur-containing complex subunit RicT [Spirochaetia bacterium]|jgi:cell fate regulator YaaT (PSP1 superfamily)|nr:regulatory iron-sulfur-containing complex subunit RicT [Spirochaetia bacterium]